MFKEKESKAQCEDPEERKGEGEVFIGTPEYLAPEILNGQESSFETDIWSFGCFMYFMIEGTAPFGYSKNLPELFEKILNHEVLSFESLSISTDLKDLILKMLIKDPQKRLTNISQIKSHPFFKEVNFSSINNQDDFLPFVDFEIEESYSEDVQSKCLTEKIKLNDIIIKIIEPLDLEIDLNPNQNDFEDKELEIDPSTINTDNFKRKRNRELSLPCKRSLVYECVVKKQSFWFHYNKYLMKIYSDKKIEFYNIFTKEKYETETINLTSEYLIEPVNNHEFYITKISKENNGYSGCFRNFTQKYFKFLVDGPISTKICKALNSLFD